MPRTAWWIGLWIAVLGLPTLPARAQPGVGLEQVEQAYAEVDFERTRALARAALERGRNDRASTARLYLLRAISAAALDQTEEARAAFLHVIAADPALRLDKSLSPKIRAPYLEARGSSTAELGKPALELTLQRRGAQLELGLRDAVHVARSIELYWRAQNQEAFTRQRFEPQGVRRVPAPSGHAIEVYMQVLDVHDNVLFEHGTPDQPRRLALGAKALAPLGPGARDAPRNATPYYATAGVLGALGLASGVAATIMFVRREDAAREWNSPECEKPGLTRGQQCASIDERRQRAEDFALGLSAAGGALLVGSVVSLLLAPSGSQAKTSFALDVTVGRLAVTWRTAL